MQMATAGKGMRIPKSDPERHQPKYCSQPFTFKSDTISRISARAAVSALQTPEILRSQVFALGEAEDGRPAAHRFPMAKLFAVSDFELASLRGPLRHCLAGSSQGCLPVSDRTETGMFVVQIWLHLAATRFLSARKPKQKIRRLLVQPGLSFVQRSAGWRAREAKGRR